MHSSSGGMFSEGKTVCRCCHTTDGPWEPDSVTAEGPLCVGCAAELSEEELARKADRLLWALQMRKVGLL